MSLEDRCYLAIGTLPMQMQKLMSSVNGVPLRRKPLTVRRKKQTQTGERHLLIINLITTFRRVLLNCRNID